MGWLILPAAILALMALPLGLSVQYDAQGLLAWLTVGFLRFPVYPRPKKKKKKQKKDGKSALKTKKMETTLPGKLSQLKPLLALLHIFLNDLRRKMKVRRLELQLVLAGDDPCDLAVNYGRVWAALGNVTALLERGLNIKKRDLRVECDFTAEEISVFARADISVSLGRMLWLLARHSRGVIKEIMNMQKGGAET